MNSMCDERLLAQIKAGDTKAWDCIVTKYKNFVICKAREYFLVGSDTDDVIQEGMIGLFKAVRDFQSDRGSSFINFAELCIRRQIETAVKASMRKKQMPLNQYVSLSSSSEDYNDNPTATLSHPNHITNPEELLIDQEQSLYIKNNLTKILSPLENNVISLYLSGKSYGEISNIIGKTDKSVDNAIQRIRKKLSAFLNKV